MALAEWLMTELDRETGARSLPSQHWAKHEYNVSEAGDDAVRVFILSSPDTIQELQEIATAVRSTVYVRRMFTYNALKAIVVRGTPEELALSEFLLNSLDKSAPPPDGQDAGTQEFRLASGPERLVHVYYLPHTATIVDFQQLVTAGRSISDARRMFT